MVGYVCLQANVGEVLLLNDEVRDLNHRVELRIVERSLAFRLDAHYTSGIGAARFEGLQFIEMDAGRSEHGRISLLFRTGIYFSFDCAGWSGDR